jgi:hypothetical protein
VATPAETEAILRGSRKGEQLKAKIIQKASEKSAAAEAKFLKSETEARERKERLLHFQKTGAARMTVRWSFIFVDLFFNDFIASCNETNSYVVEPEPKHCCIPAMIFFGPRGLLFGFVMLLGLEQSMRVVQ